MPARELAWRFVHDLAAPLGVPPRRVQVSDSTADDDWAASGGAQLSGRADGAPLRSPGAPASAVAAAAAVFRAYTGASVPGYEMLAERAAMTGMGRNAPFSPGGAFRCLPTRDGWVGISLARDSDRELLPALTGCAAGTAPWTALTAWFATTSTEQVVERTKLLGLPAAEIPTEVQPERRPPVQVTRGRAARVGSRVPLVVDLTSLWAGPLCARFLGLAGARVIKVESIARPDGARRGNPAFFDLMHRGHEFVSLDFSSRPDQDRLRDLLGAADVVLESSRPRALAQLGIDAMAYADSGAIWVSITAYGRSGDDGIRVGFGDDVAAGAGLVAWLDSVPVPVGDALADPLAGVHAAAAAAMALESENGCLLDVSMHDVCRRAAQPATGAAP